MTLRLMLSLVSPRVLRECAQRFCYAYGIPFLRSSISQPVDGLPDTSHFASKPLTRHFHARGFQAQGPLLHFEDFYILVKSTLFYVDNDRNVKHTDKSN
jgi:hypothetical protein